MKKKGRKSYYDLHIKPNLLKIEYWASEGLEEKEIMERLGVKKTTFYKYKSQKKEFAEALSRGKEDLEALVTNRIRQHIQMGDKDIIKFYATHKMGWQAEHQRQANEIRRERNQINNESNIIQTSLFERVLGDEPSE